MIYVGYDPREHIAAEVACSAIERNGGVAKFLKWNSGRAGNVYKRPYHKEDTQYIDDISGSAFSTQFSFSRFLVPYISDYKGWSGFMDCDIIVDAPVAELFSLCDEKYAVMVVKHDHNPTGFSKMDGIAQTRYDRKNWSSVVLWNNAHPSNKKIGPGSVNSMPGLWLHGFKWLKDDEIGELPVEWNYLVGHNTSQECSVPKAVHFTEGGPWLKGCENVEYASVFWNAFHRFMP